VVDGKIVVRDLVDLTISVDHRLVDGGPIARFSCDLRSLIEAGGLIAAPSEREAAGSL
jgi:pyruvate/2-oxoglutarate dehydrogenase complex dihydrolipoamide acyltransferase (E2) component